MRWGSGLVIVAVFCSCGSPAEKREPAPSSKGPAFVDLEGQTWHPLDVTPQRAHVLVFVTHDCPIANGYAPTLRRLIDAYRPRGVRFFLVHVDPDLTADAARTHAEAYGLTACPVLRDVEHTLVSRLGPTITPEVAVVTPGEKLPYRGRIDDWYAELGRKRRAPTRHDLREALDSLLAGEPVEVPRTVAVGCDIPMR